jgi:hypothetical protein
LRDDVLTWRGTLQKYYAHAGIKAFPASASDEDPSTVAPEVVYYFRAMVNAEMQGDGYLYSIAVVSMRTELFR